MRSNFELQPRSAGSISTFKQKMIMINFYSILNWTKVCSECVSGYKFDQIDKINHKRRIVCDNSYLLSSFVKIDFVKFEINSDVGLVWTSFWAKYKRDR